MTSAAPSHKGIVVVHSADLINRLKNDRATRMDIFSLIDAGLLPKAPGQEEALPEILFIQTGKDDVQLIEFHEACQNFQCTSRTISLGDDPLHLGRFNENKPPAMVFIGGIDHHNDIIVHGEFIKEVCARTPVVVTWGPSATRLFTGGSFTEKGSGQDLRRSASVNGRQVAEFGSEAIVREITGLGILEGTLELGTDRTAKRIRTPSAMPQYLIYPYEFLRFPKDSTRKGSISKPDHFTFHYSRPPEDEFRRFHLENPPAPFPSYPTLSIKEQRNHVQRKWPTTNDFLSGGDDPAFSTDMGYANLLFLHFLLGEKHLRIGCLSAAQHDNPDYLAKYFEGARRAGDEVVTFAVGPPLFEDRTPAEIRALLNTINVLDASGGVTVLRQASLDATGTTEEINNLRRSKHIPNFARSDGSLAVAKEGLSGEPGRIINGGGYSDYEEFSLLVHANISARLLAYKTAVRRREMMPGFAIGEQTIIWFRGKVPVLAFSRGSKGFATYVGINNNGEVHGTELPVLNLAPYTYDDGQGNPYYDYVELQEVIDEYMVRMQLTMERVAAEHRAARRFITGDTAPYGGQLEVLRKADRRFFSVQRLAFLAIDSGAFAGHRAAQKDQADSPSPQWKLLDPNQHRDDRLITVLEDRLVGRRYLSNKWVQKNDGVWWTAVDEAPLDFWPVSEITGLLKDRIAAHKGLEIFADAMMQKMMASEFTSDAAPADTSEHPLASDAQDDEVHTQTTVATLNRVMTRVLHLAETDLAIQLGLANPRKGSDTLFPPEWECAQLVYRDLLDLVSSAVQNAYRAHNQTAGTPQLRLKSEDGTGGLSEKIDIAKLSHEELGASVYSNNNLASARQIIISTLGAALGEQRPVTRIDLAKQLLEVYVQLQKHRLGKNNRSTEQQREGLEAIPRSELTLNIRQATAGIDKVSKFFQDLAVYPSRNPSIANGDFWLNAQIRKISPHREHFLNVAPAGVPPSPPGSTSLDKGPRLSLS